MTDTNKPKRTFGEYVGKRMDGPLIVVAILAGFFCCIAWLIIIGDLFYAGLSAAALCVMCLPAALLLACLYAGWRND